MNTRLLLTFAAAAFLAGCNTPPIPGAPKAADILILKVAPSVKYEVLGNVTDSEKYIPPHGLSESFDMGRTPDILDVIRQKAAALGADAVILNEREFEAGESTRIYVSGTAIRFLKAAPGAQAQPPPPSAK